MVDRRDSKEAKKYETETLWKLVEARCAQLADSVSAARIPFLIVLTWSFIWAWALYSVELGYLKKALDDARSVYALAAMEPKAATPSKDPAAAAPKDSTAAAPKDPATAAPKDPAAAAPKDPAAAAPKDSATAAPKDPSESLYKSGALKAYCEKVIPEHWLAKEVTPEARRLLCFEVIKARFEWNEKTWWDAHLTSFPGGFGKVTVSDLGIAGQCGLLLLLSWLFFSVRRENHAIRAIVDMDQHSRQIGRFKPAIFFLEPRDKKLSAEHYAYAYHSVAQRFVFLFSQHSRPLLIFTAALCVFPAAVASWNMYTDVRDLFSRPLETSLLMARVMFEMPLFAFIWLATYMIIHFEKDTSTLLNGWYLASRDVWEKEWDERTDTPAQMVEVNVLTQKARAVLSEEQDQTNND